MAAVSNVVAAPMYEAVAAPLAYETVAAPVTYAAAAPLTAAPLAYETVAAPVTYAAAAPTYGTATFAPTTYATQQQPVSYLNAPASISLAPMTTYGYGAAPSQLSYAFNPVAVYAPGSVQAAWDNHFEAFGKQDVDKIMLDYDETSVARVYNNVDGSKVEFAGTAKIREMFTNLFKDLPDLSTLDAPVIDVDAAGNQVFLVWKCPGCGFETATDTFLFGPDFKIKRQNIVVTKKESKVVVSKKEKGLLLSVKMTDRCGGAVLSEVR